MADKELEDFILHLNREAMTYLKQENFPLSLKTLKDAEKLLKTIGPNENLKLHGITLNNFGCFYKRINKPNVALKFLKQACEKESIEPIDRVNLAGTLLNMCAIYSQLGKHDQALNQGCQALSLLEQESAGSPNLVSTLIIAYHNTGVEYEFLNNLRQAVECYKSAWTFAVKQMGENNSLTLSIHNSYVEALEKQEKTELKTTIREQLRLNSKVKPQEKRNLSALPAIRKPKDPNPYIKPKIQSSVNQTKRLKKPEKTALEKATDLAQIRFLTGDRLQPMFQNKTQPINLRPVTVTKPADLLTRPLRVKKQREKITEQNESSDEHKEEFKHVRTASAPVNITVGNLQERIRNLEHKYNDFDKKIQPIKQQLPDLDSFKIDRITALYELEKLAEKGPQDSKWEKEKEEFLKRMEELDKENEEKVEDFEEKPEKIEEKPGKIEEKSENTEKFEEILENPKKNSGKIEEFHENPEQNSENIDDIIRDLNNIKETVHDSPTEINSSSKKTPLTITQGYFRGHLKRSQLSKKTSAAIIIQKHVRRHQCRTIYIEIREAIIFIQSVYRGHLVRKSLKPSKAIN